MVHTCAQRQAPRVARTSTATLATRRTEASYVCFTLGGGVLQISKRSAAGGNQNGAKRQTVAPPVWRAEAIRRPPRAPLRHRAHELGEARQLLGQLRVGRLRRLARDDALRGEGAQGFGDTHRAEGGGAPAGEGQLVGGAAALRVEVDTADGGGEHVDEGRGGGGGAREDGRLLGVGRDVGTCREI